MDKTQKAAERQIKKMDGKTKTIYGINTDKYIRPEQISKQINEKLRQEKENEVDLWKELYEKTKHEMPGTTPEKLSAIVHRLIQDIKHGKKEDVDPELTFKPNMSQSQKSKEKTPAKPARRGQKLKDMNNTKKSNYDNQFPPESDNSDAEEY